MDSVSTHKKLVVPSNILVDLLVKCPDFLRDNNLLGEKRNVKRSVVQMYSERQLRRTFRRYYRISRSGAKHEDNE